MSLKELIETNIENKEKYNFCILIAENFDIINTVNKITYKDLQEIVGLAISCIEVEYFTEFKSKIVHIKLKKDS